jgi:hypothetical protein
MTPKVNQKIISAIGFIGFVGFIESCLEPLAANLAQNF